MQDQLYGRLTTLNRLQQERDDPSKHKFRRQQADRAIKKIVEQLHDRTLMRLRERLIKATLAGDLHETWKIENLIRAYERNHEGLEADE